MNENAFQCGSCFTGFSGVSKLLLQIVTGSATAIVWHTALAFAIALCSLFHSPHDFNAAICN